MEERRSIPRRALALGLVLLMTAALPAQQAMALFGKDREPERAAEGAPVAENLTLRVYRGVPYTGEFRAVDNEGDALKFAIAAQPKKGAVTLTEDGMGFIYTPSGRTGADSFTYTASDEAGNTSLPATVSITIERAASGVQYADMDGNAAHTAAIDLAEHGVFVGTRVGESWFFEPERTLTRGEFVAMALAAMGLTAEAARMTGFCDDPDIPTWAKGSAVSALNAGVITGVETAEGVAYRANDAITLGEAAVVLNRLLRVTDVAVPEVDEAEAWCAQAVANLRSVSVMAAGRFAESEMSAPLDRARAAELLSAAMTLAGSRAEKGLLSGMFG